MDPPPCGRAFPFLNERNRVYESKNAIGKRKYDSHAEAGRSGLHSLCSGRAADLRHHDRALEKGGDAPAPSVSESAADPAPGEDLSSHYQIDNASAALLTETADAGADYLNDTLFLGDSNTVRLYNNGLISLQQFCAKEGIGTQAALNEGIVTFKKDSNHYTIPQAVAMMKPRRVVMTFGTNDTGMEVSDFIATIRRWFKPSSRATPIPTSS